MVVRKTNFLFKILNKNTPSKIRENQANFIATEVKNAKKKSKLKSRPKD